MYQCTYSEFGYLLTLLFEYFNILVETFCGDKITFSTIRKPDFVISEPQPDPSFGYFCTENSETMGNPPTFLIPERNPTFATRLHH